MIFMFFVPLYLPVSGEPTAYMVKDINPGQEEAFHSSSSYVNPMPVSVYGTVFFVANDGEHGYELWKTDGTEKGTMMVKDIYPGPRDGWITELANLNNAVLFPADDGINLQKMWRSDGTAEGTYRIGFEGRYPEQLTVMNGWLYFSAWDYLGEELYKTNGTILGGQIVKDIRVGSSSPYYITNANGTLYFTADDYTHGKELWKSGGTAGTTMMVRDLSPGSNSSNIKDLYAVNNILFFEFGVELWRSDGTSNGTFFLKDQFVPLSGKDEFLYFFYNMELWKSNGTVEGTQKVKDLNPYYFHFTESYTAVEMDGFLYFFLHNENMGTELWRTDGTTSGTEQVKIIWHGTGDYYHSYKPSDLANVQGTLFFSGYDEFHGKELWKSDGTPEGTGLAVEIRSGSRSSSPQNLFHHDGTLYFLADDYSHGLELWALPWLPSTAKPVIADIKDTIIQDGISYFGPKPALLQAAQPTTWTIISAPYDMDMDIDTGVVSWLNPTKIGSPFTIIIRASNEFGYDDEKWSLGVLDKPVIIPIENASITAGSPYVSPSPDLLYETLPVTWSLVTSPYGMTINPDTGIVTWSQPIIYGSPYKITIAAENSFGRDDETWFLTVNPQKNLPYPALALLNPYGEVYVSMSEGVPPFYEPGLRGSICFLYAPEERHYPLTGDVNGDFMTDLIQVTPYGDAWVALAKERIFAPPTRWGWLGFRYEEVEGDNGYLPLVGDVNGDKLADLIQITKYGDAWVALSEDSAYTTPTRWGWLGFFFLRSLPGEAGALPMSGDFNGDGLYDLSQITPYGDAWVALSTGSSFELPQRWGWLGFRYAPYDGYYPIASDVDGNGLSDLVQITPHGDAWVALSAETYYKPPCRWGWLGFHYNEATSHYILSGDVNTDLREDLIQITPSGDPWVALSSETIYDPPSRWGWLGFTWSREEHYLPLFLNLRW